MMKIMGESNCGAPGLVAEFVDFCRRVGVGVFISGIRKHEFSHNEVSGPRARPFSPLLSLPPIHSDKGVYENDDTYRYRVTPLVAIPPNDLEFVPHRLMSAAAGAEGICWVWVETRAPST